MNSVFYDICSCNSSLGLGSCKTIDCPGPCYGYQDQNGYCHCGCIKGTETKVPYFHVPPATETSKPRISLKTRGLSVSQLDKMFELTKEHGAKLKHPPGHVLASTSFSGTIAELIVYLNS